MDNPKRIQAETRAILEKADLETTTSRKIREEVAEKLGVEVTEGFKQVVEEEVTAYLKEQGAEGAPTSSQIPVKRKALETEEQPTAKKPAATEKGEVQPATDKTSSWQNGILQLSDNRKVDVRSFKGRQLVDIREFYEKDGEQKPGAKGLALSTDQWSKLFENIAAINKAVDDEEINFTLSLGNNRKVAVGSFKGRLNINLREFYEKDGNLLPGKKGIALSREQWRILSSAADEISSLVGIAERPDGTASA